MDERAIVPGLCQCGCGDPAPISAYTARRHGYVQGQPRRFIRNHNKRLRIDAPKLGVNGLPFGLCQCGCGQGTKRAVKTQVSAGRYRGMPVQFIHGHSSRDRRPGYEVDEKTGCWNYRGHIGPHGYGGIFADGRRHRVHRYFYEQAKGPIPAGLVTDHLCRNKRCVNPDHMEAVTSAENARRRPQTKLNPDLVREIRKSLAAGESRNSIGRRLQLGPWLVRSVAKGETWRGI